MQTDQPTARPTRTQSSAPSLACDLSWVLSVASGGLSWQTKHPVVADLLAGHDDLVQRVRAFWADEHTGTCFTETLVLAHHAGALAETSPAALWAALESAVQTVPTDLALASESPEERVIFLHRLQRLQESSELTRTYIELLRDVWELADTIWQSSRPMLEESGRQVLQQIERDGVTESMARGCDIFQEMLPDINGRVDAGQPLVIVPCLFFGEVLYLELPGLTLIGCGVEHNDLGARARTESLARRLKTVADPTRLALLHFLATSPSTVGQLATSFGLAQPTVSMHIKSLRQAGLVTSERRAGRLHLSADPDAVDALVDELRRAAQGASTTGSVRMPATVVEATRSAGPVTA
jgi:DNA-binding transcriptional ArsR family regulator